MTIEIAQRLLAWYQKHSRHLPWRDVVDPYRVWVSEIMLQQTRVDTVIPYYQRWMERFPTLTHLARANEQEVLQAWEGLGYYSRGRNLHRAARLVMEKYGGKLPCQREQLQKLPGIGRYTAAAIASIAFGQDAPALDGNVRRVLARLFDVRLPVRSAEGEERLRQLAAEHLPAGRAGDYNQALMDLGATICTPRAPACERCPLAALCQARALNLQEERPLTVKRPPVPHLIASAAVLRRHDGRVLITQRPAKGLLGGLWEFPGSKLEAGETPAASLQREINEELGVQIEVNQAIGVYRHAYTHFRVTLHAYECILIDGEPQAIHASDLRWVKLQALNHYPMGKIDRQIARQLQNGKGA